MSYEQTLVKIIEPIKRTTITRMNRGKKWKYGYNKEHDIVVISKTGKIGEVVEIQNLRIGLPLEPVRGVYVHEKRKWVRIDPPKELSRLKNIFDWRNYPDENKEQWYDFIDEEFKRRDEGFWFNNNGKPTYITGTHYMYLQWSKIDVGAPDFREANRLFYIFWEACKADKRCYGMCYLKNRRSGFSFMSSAETVNLATLASDSRYGVLSKTGADAKKMFTDKIVPISINYPFFFKPIQDGMDRPKTELAYRVPASKFTRKKITSNEKLEELEGLDTTIDWKNTGDNSYDGEKLALLVHDESGKWEKSGLYSLFIPMEWNYEGFIDEYGIPVFDTPDVDVLGPDGELIDIGIIEHWQNEADGLKGDHDALNEFYRQFPKTTEHAFRDEAKGSIFNLVKIYEQIDYNEEMTRTLGITTGNFQWAGGVKDTQVIFYPDQQGRFKVSWVPPQHLQNRVVLKNGVKYPGNEHMGAFGCDSYDISGTVDGQGSKGALHGLTRFSMEDAPANSFFLEYLSRPPTAEIFFEDVLMALVFYSMPILAENNKPRLLYYLRRRGYRGFSMNRPDKVWNKLSVAEKEVGGIPNSSEDIKQAHAAAIEMYIQDHVGIQQDGTFGSMYFNTTLNDWSRFDITKRTKFDATISSGLAIMANNRHLYAPNAKIEKPKLNINIAKYENRGNMSKIIKQ